MKIPFSIFNINGDFVSTNITGDATKLLDTTASFIEKLGDGIIEGTKEALLIAKVLCFNDSFLDSINERKLKDAEVKQFLSKALKPESIDNIFSSRYNQYDLLLKNARLFDVLEKVIDLLKDVPEEEILSDSVEHTFFNYFKQDVEMICDDEVRKMWVQALSEEIKQPNSISIRTLNVLRGLSITEIMLFNELLHNSYDGNVIINQDRKAPLTPKIDSDSLLLLSDAGLIDTSSIAANNYKSSPKLKFDKEENHTYGCKLGQKYLLNSSTIFHVCILPFKNAGKEIARVINYQQTQEEVIAIAKEIFNQNQNNSFYLYENCFDESGTYVPNVNSRLIWESTQ